MRPKRLSNVPRPPMLGVQLDRLEIRHVLGREKHVAHGRGLAVYPEGVAGEDDAFSDDPGRVRVGKSAHRNEVRGCRA